MLARCHIQLRDSRFSGILNGEHFDVRRFLLAGPASLAPFASPFFFRYSLFAAHYSLLKKDSPWP